MKNIFKWPKEIYIFWLVEFVLGIELIGAVLLVFFKDWGGLSQTHTQMLQSWFTLWIFFLEIPTGVFGDIYGKKNSVILGITLHIVGILVYTIMPNIWLFLLGEFIFALSVAFISGAKEAWIYDTAKRVKVEDRFREISVMGSNLHMAGMIVASLLYIPLSNIVSVQNLFRLGIVSSIVALILLWVFIKPTDGKNGLKPDYIGTIKKGVSIIKNSINLKRLALLTSFLSTISYFVIWLYQEVLRVLQTAQPEWGLYRTVLLVAQIVMIRVLGIYLKKSFNKGLITVIILIFLGFMAVSILQNSLGLIVLLILSGGVGLQVNALLSKEINEEISSEQRATVLSFIGMIKRLMLTVFNPIIGYMVDMKGVYFALMILGLLSLLGIFIKPKIKFK